MLDLGDIRDNVAGIDAGVRVRGNPSRFYGQAIVGVFDLLGFSRTVLADWGESDQSPLARILRIRQNPLIADKRSIGAGEYEVATDGKAVTNVMYKGRVHMVSDTVVLSVAFPPSLTIGDFCLAFTWMAMNQNLIWQAAIEEGFVLRGGVAIGATYWDEGGIVGPAFIDAYRLESQVAKIARVLLGETLLLAIAKVRLRDTYQLEQFLMKWPDGLIGFSPVPIALSKDRHQATIVERVQSIATCAQRPHDAEKYGGLIDILTNPSLAHVPSITEIQAGAAEVLNRTRTPPSIPLS